MKKSAAYGIQNVAIHAARAQLEKQGVFDPLSSLDQIRDMAGEINDGVRSISQLSLEQRRELIARLKLMGADVKNPVLYESDFKAEAAATGVRRKVLTFSRVTEKQLRMLDSLAVQIDWYRTDSYAHLQEKLFNAPRPKNAKEVNHLACVLRSMLERQNKSKETQVN